MAGAEARRDGSIPACAGEPRCCPAPTPVPSVYPRVCGGTATNTDIKIPNSGLSPRVRGNRAAGGEPTGAGGSIPACAGEPGGAGYDPGGKRVYPRVCGGTMAAVPSRLMAYGLSPRVRGNLLNEGDLGSCPRSIPACAGEPPFPDLEDQLVGVYPRVCGGTFSGWRFVPSEIGLSPACAGEPTSAPRRRRRRRVYPRVCGGTFPRAC